ncbi:hypothetical protein AC579_5675 [Pseudocercospora musae]|uniref:Uncharacterized protein n=1 Tax=Pseudocercospora musae TaxID=113226 RepID=A0A139HCJ4_9PEZI|nr:hypothetical protein AC579_5675 [Pseudocercospora musae]
MAVGMSGRRSALLDLGMRAILAATSLSHVDHIIMAPHSEQATNLVGRTSVSAQLEHNTCRKHILWSMVVEVGWPTKLNMSNDMMHRGRMYGVKVDVLHLFPMVLLQSRQSPKTVVAQVSTGTAASVSREMCAVRQEVSQCEEIHLSRVLPAAGLEMRERRCLHQSISQLRLPSKAYRRYVPRANPHSTHECSSAARPGTSRARTRPHEMIDWYADQVLPSKHREFFPVLVKNGRVWHPKTCAYLTSAFTNRPLLFGATV